MSAPASATQPAQRVFISHSHHDNAFCERLVNTLKMAGLDVWYD